MAKQRQLPFDDLSPRDRLCGLPLPPDQRAVLVAIYDLAPDHVTWCGPARELAAHMGCAPGTATRRAKRAAESGHLAVSLNSGRPGTYRLMGLTPAAESSAPSADEGAPTWSDVRASAMRTVSLLVALVLGARRRSARSAEVARRRRIAPLPEQLVLAFAQSAEAPIAEVRAEPVVSSAPRRAEVALQQQNSDIGAPRSGAEVSPMPCHAIVPSPCLNPQKSNPIVPSHEASSKVPEKKKIPKWWSADIGAEQLRSPAAVQSLYVEATAAGRYSASEQARLAFFAFAALTLRVGTRNPGGFFVAQLGKPGRTKPGLPDVPFEARPTIPDLDWASTAIKSLDLGPPATSRTSNLAAGEDSIERERARQREGLRQHMRERGQS